MSRTSVRIGTEESLAGRGREGENRDKMGEKRSGRMKGEYGWELVCKLYEKDEPGKERLKKRQGKNAEDK